MVLHGIHSNNCVWLWSCLPLTFPSPGNFVHTPLLTLTFTLPWLFHAQLLVSDLCEGKYYDLLMFLWVHRTTSSLLISWSLWPWRLDSDSAYAHGVLRPHFEYQGPTALRCCLAYGRYSMIFLELKRWHETYYLNEKLN